MFYANVQWWPKNLESSIFLLFFSHSPPLLCAIIRQTHTMMEQITALDLLARWVHEEGSPVYVVLFDIKAAYDWVDRGLLWWKCVRRKILGQLLGVMQALFDANLLNVGVGGEMSWAFRPRLGLL